MRNAWKLCVTVCTVFLLIGCTKQKAQISQEVLNQEVVGESVPTETKAPEHPIIENGIDYLSVEGINLEPGVEIVMIATNSDNPFYDMVEEGAEQAIEDLNEALGYSGKDEIEITFEAPENDDVIEQINMIDQFLDRAPDALCIAFSDETACRTQMDLAKDNAIKLISFDTAHETNVTDTLVATDNYAAAKTAARKLFERLEDGAKIAVIVHNKAEHTGAERYKAIADISRTAYAQKKFQFVDIVYMDQEERTQEEVFEELLESHPDLSGVICTDLLTTEGAIEYVNDEGEVPFLLVGFDMSETIKEGIEDGVLLGSVAQDPYGMGYATVIAAARSVAGMKNARNVQPDYLWVDQENLNQPEAVSLFSWEN